MNTNFFAKVIFFLKSLFVGVHTLGFEMIGWAIKDYRCNNMILAVIEVIGGICTILSFLFVDALVIYCIYQLLRHLSITLRTKEVNRYNVTGVIKSKDYQSSYISYIHTGKMLIPVHHDEEYNVRVEYKGLTNVYNSKEMFDKYETGDSISLILVEKLGKNDVVIEYTLELPE